MPGSNVRYCFPPHYTKACLPFSVQAHLSLCRQTITSAFLDGDILARAHLSFVSQHTGLAHSIVHTAEHVRGHICGLSEAGVCTHTPLMGGCCPWPPAHSVCNLNFPPPSLMTWPQSQGVKDWLTYSQVVASPWFLPPRRSVALSQPIFSLWPG